MSIKNIILILSSAIFSIAISIISKSDIVQALALFTGIMYVIFMGIEKKFCFIIGVFNALLYAYITYKNRLFGEMILNICVYFPLMIYGYIYWRDDPYITKLGLKKFILFLMIILIMTYIYSFYLKYLDSNFVYLESFIFSAGLVATILSLRKKLEHYIYISLANIVSIGIWIRLTYLDFSNLPTLIMVSYFLIIGLVFLYRWKKNCAV